MGGDEVAVFFGTPCLRVAVGLGIGSKE